MEGSAGDDVKQTEAPDIWCLCITNTLSHDGTEISYASGVRKLTFSDWVIKSWYTRVVPKWHSGLLMAREWLDKSDIDIAVALFGYIPSF